jgi:hypothetical protein
MARIDGCISINHAPGRNAIPVKTRSEDDRQEEMMIVKKKGRFHG